MNRPFYRRCRCTLALHLGCSAKRFVHSQRCNPSKKGGKWPTLHGLLVRTGVYIQGHRPVQQRTGGIDTRARGFWVTTWDPFENNVVPLTLPSLVCPRAWALSCPCLALCPLSTSSAHTLLTPNPADRIMAGAVRTLLTHHGHQEYIIGGTNVASKKRRCSSTRAPG